MKPNGWREVVLIIGCFAFGCLIVGMIELYKNFDFEIKKVTQEKVPAIEKVIAVKKVAIKDKVIEVKVISLAEPTERVTGETKISEKRPPPPDESNLVIKPTRKDMHLSDCNTGQILVYTEHKGAHCIRDTVLPE